MGGQTTYNYRSNPAVAGMPFDTGDSANEIRSYPAAVAVPFGVAVELTSTGVQPAQTATTGAPPAKMIGISVYDPAREQSYPPGSTGVSTTGYAVGEMVPVLVRGSIWVQGDGGGTWPATFGAVNVWHSSDGTHNQGVFTMTAPATTAGAEIDTAAAWVSGFTPFPTAQPGSDGAWTGTFTDGWGNTNKLFPLSVNFPGHV